MRPPQTTSGIREHLSKAGYAFHFHDFDKFRLGRPVQSLTHDCAFALTMTGDQVAQIHVEVTITPNCMMLIIPWLVEPREVRIDHLQGSPLAYDTLLSQVFRALYEHWDDRVYPGFRAQLERDGFEVGPYRFGSEFRPFRDVLAPPTQAEGDNRLALTVFRVLAHDLGSKRVAVEAASSIHSLSHSEAANRVSALVQRRPEYFDLEPGRAYKLTARGYEILNALELKCGEDVPWPL